jgi:hypothetical protein
MRNTLLLFFVIAFFISGIAQNVGIGTTNPTGPLSFANTLGNKIVLWGDGNSGHYGLGIQSAQLQVYTDGPNSFIVFGHGRSGAFKERVRISNSFDTAMSLMGRMIMRNGTEPVNSAYGPGIWLSRADNTGLLGFMGTQNNKNLGFYGGPQGWGFTYDAINSRVGIANNDPAVRLDIGGGNNWDLINGEGDLRIGNPAYRIKMGIALGGGGVGSATIMQAGGVGVLNLGAQSKEMLQLNGGGNFINLANIGGGLRVNGNAGSSGQVLRSNGGAGAPQWKTPPYFIYLRQTPNTNTTLAGINVHSVPIPGLDGVAFTINELSTVVFHLNAMLRATVTGYTAGGYFGFGLLDVGASNTFFSASAWAFANSYDGGSASEIVVRDLNPGTYIIRARHHRYEVTWSGDSKMYNATILMNVYPQ